MKAEHCRQVFPKLNSKPKAFNSPGDGEEVRANSAFKKCWTCAEARKKLKKLLSQRGASNMKTGFVT